MVLVVAVAVEIVVVVAAAVVVVGMVVAAGIAGIAVVVAVVAGIDVGIVDFDNAVAAVAGSVPDIVVVVVGVAACCYGLSCQKTCCRTGLGKHRRKDWSHYQTLSHHHCTGHWF